MCSGLVIANKRDLRVHGCFTEEGDLVLSAFSWDTFQAKLQENQQVSLAS